MWWASDSFAPAFIEDCSLWNKLKKAILFGKLTESVPRDVVILNEEGGGGGGGDAITGGSAPERGKPLRSGTRGSRSRLRTLGGPTHFEQF